MDKVKVRLDNLNKLKHDYQKAYLHAKKDLVDASRILKNVEYKIKESIKPLDLINEEINEILIHMEDIDESDRI